MGRRSVAQGLWPWGSIGGPRLLRPRARSPGLRTDAPSGLKTLTDRRPFGALDKDERDHSMGHWGVKSFENDDADDALDAGFDRVHGAVYDELMDDRNPMTFDQAQKTLANAETLMAAVEALREAVGKPFEE